MNYIVEINAFYAWLITNPISSDAQSLWHALMHVNNKCAWARTFTVANGTLLGMLGFSQSQLSRCRAELVGAGRIKHIPRPGGQCPIYAIISFQAQPVEKPLDNIFPIHNGHRPAHRPG